MFNLGKKETVKDNSEVNDVVETFSSKLTYVGNA